jgi:transposase
MGKLRPKIPRLTDARDGRFGAHHAVVAASILDRLDSLGPAIAGIDAQIAARIASRYGSAARQLHDVPRIDRAPAEVITAETAVITADAMHSQRGHATYPGGRRHYVLAV